MCDNMPANIATPSVSLLSNANTVLSVVMTISNQANWLQRSKGSSSGGATALAFAALAILVASMPTVLPRNRFRMSS